MGRAILLSSLASSVVSMAVTLMVVNFAVPAAVEAQSASVRYETVAVTGPSGGDQVRLWSRPTGGGVVSVLGDDGTLRAQLATGGGTPPNPVGAGLNLNQPDGTPAARLGVNAAGDGMGNPTLILRDRDGESRLVASVEADGATRLLLLHADGSAAGALTMSSNGAGLSLFDENGNTALRVGRGRGGDGTAPLGVRVNLGAPGSPNRITMQVTDDGAGITVWNNGQVTWSTP